MAGFQAGRKMKTNSKHMETYLWNRTPNTEEDTQKMEERVKEVSKTEKWSL